ncbi:ATP-dependent rRNA helicase spb4 [Puccinia graminis f. sp. tritici]|uniref:ATP-dependent RNA helicase n=1 Tax=Puccinia graminis f. sp. tritici TaxID=56615 RepID=A0A5B0RCS3_PUCGR|nr:ATP-dependent rRNA helicase spb4 [Puccinia graminis f. sp. tritici]
MAIESSQTNRFDELNPPLTSWVSDTIKSFGFQQMTPVQAHTIPLFLQNKDVVVQAVTGSGKTLAFVIPIIERLIQLEPRPHSHVAAIIISPTRELATQTFQVLNQFLENRPSTSDQASCSSDPVTPFLKAMLLIGGTGARSIKQDLSEFQEYGANILVATPGRLEEFLFGYSSLNKRKTNDLSEFKQRSQFKTLANLKSLEVLVLDEADRLLDLGFAPVLSNILGKLPKQRRTGLFSATLLNDGLTELIRAGLRNPVKVLVKVQTAHQNLRENEAGPTALTNQYIAVPKVAWKMPQLVRLLNHLAFPDPEENTPGARKLIIYFATCACVEYFYKILSVLDELKSFSVHSLHGQQSPTRRSMTFTAFKNSNPLSPAVLLCTDLVARGLDLPDVDVVIQFDPPKDVRNFFHRIGRTARAGKSGRAIVLLQSNRELDYVDYLKLKNLHLKPLPYIRSCSRSNGAQGSEIATDSAAEEFIRKVKNIVKTDRALHDRGVKAFVSYVQFYSKHEASYIFKLDQIDLLSLAFHGFGLIKLPKMPELKKFRTQIDLVTPDGFEVGQEEFDWPKYSYLDPLKETQRQEKYKQTTEAQRMIKESNEANNKSSGLTKPSRKSGQTSTPIDKKIQALEQKKLPEKAAWSKKINAKISKEQKRLKRLREQEAGGPVDNNQDNQEDNKKDEGDDDDDDDGETDWKELVMEKKTLKKLKLDLDHQKSIDRLPITDRSNPAQSSSGFDKNLGEFFLGLA